MDPVAKCCPCLLSEESRMRNAVSRGIDREMDVHKKFSRKELKMLLLGTGEAGKSTVLKQMQIIHGQEFADERKRIEFVQSIRENIFEAMIIMLNAMDQFDIPLEHEGNQKHAQLVRKQGKTYCRTDKGVEDQEALNSLMQATKKLWEDSGVQEAYHRRNEYTFVYLSDSTKYFLQRLDAIAKPNYVPTQDDILRVRKSSTGVKEYSFKVRQVYFRVVDVGGQRTERRKWIHCFEKVTSIIFVSALSDYDQMVLEVDAQGQEGVNRLQESLALFNVIIHERFLQEAAIILFLNKTDIFDDKIKVRDMGKYIPEYNEYKSKHRSAKSKSEGDMAKEFVLQMFLAYVKSYLLHNAEIAEKEAGERKKRDYEADDPDKLLYSHLTCATDTEGMRFVTTAVEDYNLRISLMDFHLQ
ncbi:guanine nucleotide-binding protein G(q) subunit alpha-like [Paramacrobiotus metropolitanus]|uniref:guanine nucleotide-binding protein G(q) subunit alpha-like n=1 Tax=Paramacrobiotus metropolitanus TaxID=2943436 RepID=UPI002445EDEE|nr:guanine nucleotide-binding protein G(q) subunit alpha-like [Paramacrobiotus metropolitanus]